MICNEKNLESPKQSVKTPVSSGCPHCSSSPSCLQNRARVGLQNVTGVKVQEYEASSWAYSKATIID